MQTLFRDKTALITGASGGIGREFARQLATQGTNLILVARTHEKLEIAANELRQNGVTVITIAADLADPGGVDYIVAELSSQRVNVDVLINNAGVGDHGFFHETDRAKQSAMIHLNITSLVSLTHALLPGMVARRFGRVLNVASVAAFQPGPLMSVYYASKAFVLSFSQAIGNELEGTGVTVTALCPGPVDTGFQAAAGIVKKRRMRASLLLSPQQVAEAGLAGLATGKAVVIPGLMNKIIANGVRFLPRSVVVKMARSYQILTD